MKMLKIDLQESNEKRFARDHICGHVLNELEELNDSFPLFQSVKDSLLKWYATPSYASKEIRKQVVESMDQEQLARKILVMTTLCQREEPFTSVSSQLSSYLDMDDKPDSIKTAAELLAVIAYSEHNFYHIYGTNSSITIKSNIRLSSDFHRFILMSKYLPPMVCQPLKVTNNNCGYLTISKSLLLGHKSCSHGQHLATDVIDMQNQIAMSYVDIGMEEVPSKELSGEAAAQFLQQKKEQEYITELMVAQGNKFYFTHRFDKRGRIYSSGYHLNTQGTPWKKAVLQLSEKEYIEIN